MAVLELAREPLPDPVRCGPPNRWSLLEVHAVGGPDSGRVWSLGPGVHTIGSGPQDTIRIDEDRLSAAAIRLTVTVAGEAWMTMSVSIPLQPDTDSVRWPEGEDLLLYGVALRLAGSDALDPGDSGAATPSAELIKYPRPPDPPRSNPLPWPLVFAPLLIGLGPGLLLRLPTVLGLTLLTPVFALAHWGIGRHHNRRAFGAAMAEYLTARWATEDTIRTALRREREALREAAIDPARTALAALDRGPGLWARGPGRADVLKLRIGTSDQASAIVTADHKGVGKVGPEAGGAPRILRGVPQCVDLARCGVLGVAGELETARGLARWLVLQAAVRRNPNGLRIHLVADTTTCGGWSWLGRLPHTGPPGVRGGSRDLVTADPARVAQRIAYLLALIDDREAGRRAGGRPGAGGGAEPGHLVVLDGAGRPGEADGVARILKQGPGVGIFVLCVEAAASGLPEECAAVVRCEPGGLALEAGGAVEDAGIRPDLVTADWCERVARALATAAER